jgi:alpha-aminoadipic semialdehyde synthase
MGRGGVGILREVVNRWERRAPLVPSDVQKLVKQGIPVTVQPSPRRVFADSEYRAAGALISEDLSSTSLILGVKQPSAQSILRDKSYMFFGHVIKGQQENMPLLDKCIEARVRFFDYECIADANDKRLVAFGRFAGNAGFIDCLRGIGQRLLCLGYSTPFLAAASSYMYPSLNTAKAAVIALGQEINRVGLPEGLHPMVFTFTGAGNVSLGAQEIFELLPHKWVESQDLEKELRSPTHPIIGVKAQLPDLVQRIDSSVPLSKAEYYEHPELYEPIFHKNLAKYTNVLVNGVYWDQTFPRILTKDQARHLFSVKGNLGLLFISDISCDINGSIEFLVRSSSIEDPFYIYDPLTDMVHSDMCKFLSPSCYQSS